MAVDLAATCRLRKKRPAPPKPPTTVTRVIVRGEYKKRRKGQQTLFNAEGVIVYRTYDSDGSLIGYRAVPITNFRRLV